MENEYKFTIGEHLEKLKRGDADSIAFENSPEWNKSKEALKRIEELLTLTPLEKAVYETIVLQDFQKSPTARALLLNMPFREIKETLSTIIREKEKPTNLREIADSTAGTVTITGKLNPGYDVVIVPSGGAIIPNATQSEKHQEVTMGRDDDAIVRFGTDKDLSLSDVKGIVKRCKAFIDSSGKIPEFCKKYSEGKYQIETLRKWLKDPQFTN